MSKITSDTLTLSGIGCLITVPIWQQWASKSQSAIGHDTRLCVFDCAGHTSRTG